MNHQSSFDFEKTLDQFWHFTCPTNKAGSEKSKKKHNSEEQIWRYPADKQKEKAVVKKDEMKKHSELQLCEDELNLLRCESER